MSSAWRCFSCTSSPSRHSRASSRWRAPGFRRRLAAGDAPARDVELVDRVERADRVAGEHVGEPGCEPAAGDDARVVRLRLGVEREQRTGASRRGRPPTRTGRPAPTARRASAASASPGNARRRSRRGRRGAGRRGPAVGLGAVVQRAATSRACSRRRAATITRSTPGVSMSWRAARTPTSPSPTTRTVFTQPGSPEVGALQLAPAAAAGRRHRALAPHLHHDRHRPRRWPPRATPRWKAFMRRRV